MPEFTSADETALRELLAKKKLAAESGVSGPTCKIHANDGSFVELPVDHPHAKRYFKEKLDFDLDAGPAGVETDLLGGGQ